jgi:hypothetical protein
VEVVPVSREKLKDTVSSLKRQADDLLARIDRLRR